MKKHLLSLFIFIAYCAILIKVMVFKDIPTIRIGSLLLNFAGTDGGHPANFIPFKTILPYVLGFKGWIIAGINLVGNIALLVPIGFLIPLVYKNITWKKIIILAVVSGLTIETLQVALHVGIFDIDDVILNALGVIIGYGAFNLLIKWIRSRKYILIIITILIVVAAAMAAVYAVHPKGQHPAHLGIGADGNQSDYVKNGDKKVLQNGDPCGGTGGIGQIMNVKNNTLTIEKNDGKSLAVNLSNQATIKTSIGLVSESDLKTGDRVTLIGGPNSDGSFTADTVVVCEVEPKKHE